MEKVLKAQEITGGPLYFLINLHTLLWLSLFYCAFIYATMFVYDYNTDYKEYEK